jgi:hypothetical protein
VVTVWRTYMATTNNSKLRQKLDQFWRVLFLDEHGRPKSAMFLYSFCLSLLFLLIYSLSYFFLIDVIEKAMPNADVLLRNIAQSILPGLAGSVVCCATYFLFSDRRMVPLAYLWLVVFALLIFFTMVLLISKDDFQVFLYFFAMLVPTGLISGGITSLLLLRRDRHKEAEEKTAC